MKFQIAYSSGKAETVDATDRQDALRQIKPRVPRGSIVGVAGARGGSPKFFAKRDDGDTLWPISAETAAFSRQLFGTN